jgi:hypothetical protein
VRTKNENNDVVRLPLHQSKATEHHLNIRDKGTHYDVLGNLKENCTLAMPLLIGALAVTNSVATHSDDKLTEAHKP